MSLGVNSDADGTSEDNVELSALELLSGETLAFSGVGIVSSSAAVNNGSQQADGLRESLGRLSNTGVVAAELAGRLVEPGFYSVSTYKLKSKKISKRAKKRGRARL